MSEKLEDIDWSLATWEGSRREQIRRWSKLTMDQILAAQEEMAIKRMLQWPGGRAKDSPTPIPSRES
jgi:hypothetical protein